MNKTAPRVNQHAGYNGLPEIKVWWPEHTPSWKPYGKGWATTRICLEHSGGLLIVASETHDGGEGKRCATKEVFAHIPKEAADMLLEILKGRQERKVA